MKRRYVLEKNEDTGNFLKYAFSTCACRLRVWEWVAVCGCLRVRVWLQVSAWCAGAWARVCVWVQLF